MNTWVYLKAVVVTYRCSLSSPPPSGVTSLTPWWCVLLLSCFWPRPPSPAVITSSSLKVKVESWKGASESPHFKQKASSHRQLDTVGHLQKKRTLLYLCYPIFTLCPKQSQSRKWRTLSSDPTSVFWYFPVKGKLKKELSETDCIRWVIFQVLYQHSDGSIHT